jgi:GWxTD domain-containing protein
MKRIIILIIAIAYCQISLFAQEMNQNQESSEFDAIIFKSDIPQQSRIDVYALIPYQTLNFINTDNSYGAKYSLNISIFDSTDKIAYTNTIERIVKESDYFTSIGGTGKFDYVQRRIDIAPGNYRIKVVLEDKISTLKFDKSRAITALDFYKFPFSLSGIMLVSSIEENAGKYKITPHITDNISALKDGWFAFFETYNDSTERQADFVFQIADKDNKVVAGNNRINMTIPHGKSQHYLQIPYKPSMKAGDYTLRVFALTPSEKQDYSPTEFLAITQRSISNLPTLGTYVVSDIDEAIAEMIYVAESADIKNIKDAPDEQEKTRRFYDFWKKIDPTPGTDVNEAFEQYYMRINFANKNFKGYYKGWQTDKGKVYIIYGPPLSAEPCQGSANINAIYECWVYGNGRSFMFYDTTGLGDFRLYRPYDVTDKYMYQG